jgi:hypothetical protein
LCFRFFFFKIGLNWFFPLAKVFSVSHEVLVRPMN